MSHSFQSTIVAVGILVCGAHYSPPAPAPWQKLLWRVACWVGVLGGVGQQRNSGVIKLCQQGGDTLPRRKVSEAAPTKSQPGRLKESKKNGPHQNVYSWRKLLQIPDPLAHALKLANNVICVYNPGAQKLLPLSCVLN